MTGENSLLEATGVGKTFGELKALDGISLALRRGEVLGLVGPNGAGKSTFLKICVGIVHPSAGRLLVDGFDIGLAAERARARIGYLPGEAGAYSGWRGRDFLEFCLAGYPERADRRTEDFAARLEVPLHKRIRQYSTGMRRKLLLLQALSCGAPLLLLDEPTESLDPTSRILLLQIVRELAREGRGVIFSSHQLDEVERVCDRIAFLDRGRLLDCDSTESIRAKASRVVRITLERPVAEEELRRKLSDLPVASLELGSAPLQELYATLYGVKR